MATDFDLTQQSYASEGKHSGMLKGLRSIMFPFVSWQWIWLKKQSDLINCNHWLKSKVTLGGGFYRVIPVLISWIIFCREDFRFFFCHFIPVFLEDFPFAVKISFFLLQFLSCFSGSFSAVKISDFSFISSFHFSWIIFCSEDFWSFLPISFHFSWIIFCSSDFRLLT